MDNGTDGWAALMGSDPGFSVMLDPDEAAVARVRALIETPNEQTAHDRGPFLFVEQVRAALDGEQ